MRETPSRGVGSIHDQGVNYIQLNILTADTAFLALNATLNKKIIKVDRHLNAAKPNRHP